MQVGISNDGPGYSMITEKQQQKKHYLCLIFGVLCKYIVSLHSLRWNCVTTNYSWLQTSGTRKFYERSGGTSAYKG